MNAVPYLVGTPPNWASGVSKFTVEGADPKYELVGPCPRCEHKLSKNLSDMISAPGYAGGAARNVEIRVKCNCDQPHDGQPDDIHGCGAEGSVKVRLR
jgi:hypothetical protein